MIRHLSLIVPGWLARSAILCGLAACLVGCQKRLDYEEYGEIVETVPPEFNQPYPLPELDKPAGGPSPSEPAEPK